MAKCAAHSETAVILSAGKYVRNCCYANVWRRVCVPGATVKLIGIDFFFQSHFLLLFFIQMDLQMRNSIYQCNPTCNFEKKNKLHSSVDQPSNLFERFEREREKQRKTYLNKMVSAHRHCTCSMNGCKFVWSKYANKQQNAMENEMHFSFYMLFCWMLWHEEWISYIAWI